MESRNLLAARGALSTFESNIGESDAARALSEGLDRLDQIVMESTEEAGKARTIGDRYVAVALKHVKTILATRNATQPELTNAHHLMRAVAEYEFGDSQEIKRVSSDVVEQLFDTQYVGYSNEEKIKILEREIDERTRRT